MGNRSTSNVIYAFQIEYSHHQTNQGKDIYGVLERLQQYIVSGQNEQLCKEYEKNDAEYASFWRNPIIKVFKKGKKEFINPETNRNKTMEQYVCIDPFGDILLRKAEFLEQHPEYLEQNRKIQVIIKEISFNELFSALFEQYFPLVDNKSIAETAGVSASIATKYHTSSDSYMEMSKPKSFDMQLELFRLYAPICRNYDTNGADKEEGKNGWTERDLVYAVTNLVGTNYEPAIDENALYKKIGSIEETGEVCEHIFSSHQRAIEFFERLRTDVQNYIIDNVLAFYPFSDNDKTLLNILNANPHVGDTLLKECPIEHWSYQRMFKTDISLLLCYVDRMKIVHDKSFLDIFIKDIFELNEKEKKQRIQNINSFNEKLSEAENLIVESALFASDTYSTFDPNLCISLLQADPEIRYTYALAILYELQIGSYEFWKLLDSIVKK